DLDANRGYADLPSGGARRQQISSMGRLLTKEIWKTCQYAKSAGSKTWDLEVYSVLRNSQIILDVNVPIS
ncbi:hypothetical protein L195_g009370, partial [Trifolium pratense]